MPQNKLSSFDFESGDEVLLDKIRNVTTEKFRCDRAYMVGKICCCPGWDRAKVSENIGVTGVVPVTPVVTSLVTVLLGRQLVTKCIPQTPHAYHMDCQCGTNSQIP